MRAVVATPPRSCPSGPGRGRWSQDSRDSSDLGSEAWDRLGRGWMSGLGADLSLFEVNTVGFPNLRGSLSAPLLAVDPFHFPPRFGEL